MTQYITKIRRPNHRSFRLSDEELALVSAAAKRENLDLSDWFRRAVLSAATDKDSKLEQRVLLEEIQMIKLVLINTIPKILSGKSIDEETGIELMKKANSMKREQAINRLSEARETPLSAGMENYITRMFNTLNSYDPQAKQK